MTRPADLDRLLSVPSGRGADEEAWPASTRGYSRLRNVIPRVMGR